MLLSWAKDGKSVIIRHKIKKGGVTFCRVSGEMDVTMTRMKKPKVMIVNKIPKQAEEFIGQFCEYEKWEGAGKIPREELLNRLHDKEGVLLSGITIDETFLNRAPNLRVISNVSVGYNNFHIDEMRARGIIGTNTAGSLDDTVADLIFGLMLATARRISELDRYVKDGKWKREDIEDLFGLDVHHATLGIIGMGRIGEAVAKRARLGFDMEVLYFNRNPRVELEAKLGVIYCDFDKLLQTSDFILLMTPLSKETFHMIDFREFNLMKKTAIFINASRGQTVNEMALIDALENQKIYGAGIDVYEVEPIELNNPLRSLSNVVTIPHIGSSTEKTRADMAMLAAKNLVAALTGGTPPNIVPELKNLI